MKMDKGWYADDGNATVYYPDCTSGKGAADAYVADGDWGEDDEKQTWWLDIHVWREDEEGEHYDDDRVSVSVHPEEPDCDDGDHSWNRDSGGCSENPGVWGHGGGVLIVDICAKCGLRRETDSWAQDPITGRQGLESTRYV